MSILYLLTSPEPKIKGADAVFQEVETLADAFNGAKINLHPFSNPGSRFPRQLFGFHALSKLRKLEKMCELNHVFYPELYEFPVLRFLKNPIIYTITASLDPERKPHNINWIKQLHAILVSNERDARTLKQWGINNFHIVPPGIDTSIIKPNKLIFKKELHLLMASAPWVENQFDLKGIDALLDAAKQLPHLKVNLLWRGLLENQARVRIAALGLEDRVNLISKRVDISEWLAKSHATILLAKRGDIVKAFPHSLLESVAAQKPVIISDTIPMADMVRDIQCGVVVKSVNAQSLIKATGNLESNYSNYVENTKNFETIMFSPQTIIDAHKQVYFG